MLDAAYDAFRAGLTSALTVSAAMIFVAGLIAAFTIRPGVDRDPDGDDSASITTSRRWWPVNRTQQP